ncbi:hypothetical protein ACGFIF_41045 [Kribbella sp. NPDC049174]|jgi:hypothetical protein|uniref:hypothetical protein n=1 Tax=Kribbella sp. NPDC049174 TaxID=3364112 RepID=UPI0037102784
MTAGRYVARIVEVPDHGIRFEPAADSVAPEQPTEVNLLGMAIALALGAAGYRHHAEQRDPELQTLDALLSGDAVMPWRAAAESGEDAPYIVCELNDGRPTCEVRPSAD